MREYCGFKVLELEDEEMKGEDNEQGNWLVSHDAAAD